MKKIIFIFATAFCLSANSFAQNAAKYCDLIVYRPNFKNYIAEMHTEGNITRQKALVKDANGHKIKFASEADALNYVTKDGWELVSSYYNSHQGETHFILKK